MMESDGVSFVKLWVYLTLGGLAVGVMILLWITVLGPAFNQADYHNFNTSPQHLNAVTQKFADDCQQLAESHDATTRKAIEQDIYQVASTVDLNQIQMPDGTRACVKKAITDGTGGK